MPTWGATRIRATPGRARKTVSLASLVALSLSAVALANGGASIPPPPASGAWQQLGRTVTSRPGKMAHFYRLANQPTALGVVADSSSNKPIRLTWFAYCEEQSDDGMTTQNQAVVTQPHRVVVYPPVFGGATLCTVSVTIRVVGGRANAAIFDY